MVLGILEVSIDGIDPLSRGTSAHPTAAHPRGQSSEPRPRRERRSSGAVLYLQSLEETPEDEDEVLPMKMF
jgi:hypothetical protein